MGKSKKFRPAKIPRILPGSVPIAVMQADLKIYNDHRYNVFYAKTRIDTKPLIMNPHYYLNQQRLKVDSLRLAEIDRDNKKLLMKIIKINRMGGYVDSFNPHAYTRNTKWRAHERDMLAVQKANQELYRRIVATGSLYSVALVNKWWKNIETKIRLGCKYPVTALFKKSIDLEISEQPSISDMTMEKTGDRPKVFMDIQVKDGVPLGRMIIELYNDYVPVTVQNFITICKGKKGLTYKNCPIHRAIPGEYLETGDITLGNGRGGTSIYGDSFDEENFTLKHARPGVLSMKRIGRGSNNSQFSITFAKMEKLDGKRVVFGKVVKGNKTLFQVQDLGRKFGKPQASLIISNCGVCKANTTNHQCYVSVK